MNNPTSAALEDLRKELVRLSPAVEHIEAAHQVVATVSQLPKQHQQSLAEAIHRYDQQLNESHEAYRERTAALYESYGTLLQQVTDGHTESAANIRSRLLTHADTLGESVKTYLTETEQLRNGIKQQLNALEAQLKEQTKQLHTGVSEAINDLVQTTDHKHTTAVNAIRTETAAVTNLRQIIEAYYEHIAKIDFPTRLEKLDATVAGIMSATQTTQQRVDNLERKVEEGNQKLTTAVMHEVSKLDIKLTTLKTLAFVLIALISVTMGLMVYIILA